MSKDSDACKEGTQVNISTAVEVVCFDADAFTFQLIFMLCCLISYISFDFLLGYQYQHMDTGSDVDNSDDNDNLFICIYTRVASIDDGS